MSERAPFLVIEGLDGAGTTTQVEALCGALRATGTQVVQTREPTTGLVGRVARMSLAGEPEAPPMEALPWLFAADRADHVFRQIDPERNAGRWVVSDRYVPSSLAYQSLTLPLEDVFALNAAFPAPDLLIFVDVPVDVCLARLGERSHLEIYERKDRLDAISAAYERVLERLARRGDRIAHIDGTLPIGEVTRQIRLVVSEEVGWPLS